MANIKFSQFTVGNTESDIDFVVGYKGANNIQISPANLLSATLTGYLPLTGGTMSGNIVFTDNVQAQFGTGNDLRLVHNGSDSYIQQTGVGDLILQQTVTDADISFQADNGSGGITEYFRLDGSTVQNTFSKTTHVIDNFFLGAGSSTDLYLMHNGTDSSIINNTGNLTIQNNHNDGDILFRSDDGSGGTATYFFLDGQNTRTEFLKDVKFPDNVKANFGTSVDLKIYHDGADSVIQNDTGDLEIQNRKDDGDIVFKSDDGSGGVAEYFRLDGGNTNMVASKTIIFNDSIKASFGNSEDLKILHNGTDSVIINERGNLDIQQRKDDADIIFSSDNGSGGTATYFFLDGSLTNGSSVLGATRFPDKSKIFMGTSGDLEIFHDGSNSAIENYTGNLELTQHLNDGDIIFKSDNGSGGTTEYFRLDGGLEQVIFNKEIKLTDSVKIKVGSGGDLQLFHNGTNSFIQNSEGDLNFTQNVNDGDILFKCDDGSGGVTTYFMLDGGAVLTRVAKSFLFEDNIKSIFGGGSDLQIYHSGTDSFINNDTGDLYLKNFANDKDIIFQSDDGSGGVTDYLRIDGSTTTIVSFKDMTFGDSVKATFGVGSDLQIYHDGSNSFIQDLGTGDIRIASNIVHLNNAASTEVMLKAIENGAVELYYDNSKKFETTSTGIKITGISEYADNTAAIAGGLTTGDVYRTGDLLKIVH